MRVCENAPSTSIIWPETYSASSDNRNDTTVPMFSGRPIFLSGIIARRFSNVSGTEYTASAIAVLIRPGATALTRTPRGPHSAAAWRVKAETPAFDAEYKPPPTWEISAAIEEILTIEPPVRSRCGSAKRERRTTARKLTEKTRSM